MPIPWPAEILPDVAAFGLASALAGSLVGAYMGARLGADDGVPQGGGVRWAGLAGGVAMAAMIGFALYTPSQSGVSAQVTLRDVQSGPQREAIVTAKLSPPSAAKDATWLTATAWQGDRVVLDRLKEIRPGVYQSTKPIPVHGNYKTLIRLHSGNALSGLPIYAPADDAIPVGAVAAPARFERAFVSDKKLLQREAKVGDPTVTIAAYAVIGFFTLLLLAALAFGMHRLRVTSGTGGGHAPPSESPRQAVLADLRCATPWLTHCRPCLRIRSRPRATATSRWTSASRSSAAASRASGWRSGSRQAGIDDFVILERADDVGGTWEANTYPGCQCDVPSHLYSFSFELNPSWTRTYSKQDEIWHYLRRCTDRYGLRPYLRLGHELTGATWDEEAGRWLVETSRGVVLRAARHRRDRAVEPARPPRDPRTAALRGQDLPLGAVGPRARPQRRARRRHRDRRLGDPVRPAHPAAGRQAAPLPAHAAVDHAPHRPADLELRAPPVPAAADRPAARTRLRLLDAESYVLGFAKRPASDAERSASRGCICASRCATRSCAASCSRTSASAASACCSPTSSIRR